MGDHEPFIKVKVYTGRANFHPLTDQNVLNDNPDILRTQLVIDKYAITWRQASPGCLLEIDRGILLQL